MLSKPSKRCFLNFNFSTWLCSYKKMDFGQAGRPSILEISKSRISYLFCVIDTYDKAGWWYFCFCFLGRAWEARDCFQQFWESNTALWRLLYIIYVSECILWLVIHSNSLYSWKNLSSERLFSWERRVHQ